MNSYSESADEEIKFSFFETIKKCDTPKFTKYLDNLKTRLFDITDDQNMNGK